MGRGPGTTRTTHQLHKKHDNTRLFRAAQKTRLYCVEKYLPFGGFASKPKHKNPDVTLLSCTKMLTSKCAVKPFATRKQTSPALVALDESNMYHIFGLFFWPGTPRKDKNCIHFGGKTPTTFHSTHQSLSILTASLSHDKHTVMVVTLENLRHCDSVNQQSRIESTL